MYETSLVIEPITRTYRIKKHTEIDFLKDELKYSLIRQNLKRVSAVYPSTADQIAYLLRLLGIPNNIRGYHYLIESIEFVIKNPEMDSITKFIYPALARKHVSTSERVERDIRSALCHLKIGSTYYSIFWTDKKKSNKRFICGLADFLR